MVQGQPFQLGSRAARLALPVSPEPQGKLVYILAEAVFDVAVDIRLGSPTFARWTSVELSAENKRRLLAPAGFARGFV